MLRCRRGWSTRSRRWVSSSCSRSAGSSPGCRRTGRRSERRGRDSTDSRRVARPRKASSRRSNAFGHRRSEVDGRDWSEITPTHRSAWTALRPVDHKEYADDARLSQILGLFWEESWRRVYRIPDTPRRNFHLAVDSCFLWPYATWVVDL